MMDYEALEMDFNIRGYLWGIDGEKVIPSEIELQEVVDKATTMMYDEPEGTQIEVGHLIIKKRTADLFDVFFHYGTIGEDNE